MARNNAIQGEFRKGSNGLGESSNPKPYIIVLAYGKVQDEYS